MDLHTELHWLLRGGRELTWLQPWTSKAKGRVFSKPRVLRGMCNMQTQGWWLVPQLSREETIHDKGKGAQARHAGRTANSYLPLNSSTLCMSTKHAKPSAYKSIIMLRFLRNRFLPQNASDASFTNKRVTAIHRPETAKCIWDLESGDNNSLENMGSAAKRDIRNTQHFQETLELRKHLSFQNLITADYKGSSTQTANYIRWVSYHPSAGLCAGSERTENTP